jgi:hypothetical protein
MNSKILWAIYLLCGIAFFVYTQISISWSQHDTTMSHEIESITIMQRWLIKTISWIPVVPAGVLLLITIWPTRAIPEGYRWVAFLYAVLGFIGSCLMHAMHNLAPWTEHGRIQDAQGNVYVFCDQSFLQGQTMALTKQIGATDYTTTYKMLGTTNGDSPRSFLTIVRPSNSTESYGQLYLANNQWLLGVRYDNHCFLVYDLVNQKFYGHGDIENLSPFLALRATQNWNQADVAKIEKLLKEASSFNDGRPKQESLEQGLQHPNPELRKLAAEWLELLK